MKKSKMFLLTTLSILTGCSFKSTSKGVSEATFTQIGQAEAKEMMENRDDIIILDVRTPDEYSGGHIPGAVLLPNEVIGSGDISILPDKDQTILVYCRSGSRSKQAATKLSKLGYTNVYEFGGIMTWPYEITK